MGKATLDSSLALPSEVRGSHADFLLTPLLGVCAGKSFLYVPKENYTKMLIIVVCHCKNAKTTNVLSVGEW